MPGLFYRLGAALRPAANKGRWLWFSATGDEADIIRAEADMGADLAAATLAEVAGARVDQLTGPAPPTVAAVGRLLTARVRDQRRSFAFYLTAAGEPNAFALPGGHIFITPALLELIGPHEDQLAFVLGHEMAHVIQKHALERLAGDAALGAALRTIRLGGRLAPYLKQTGLKLLTSAYSQDRELAADRIGAALADAAGYDIEAGSRLLLRLATLHQSGSGLPLAEYFASHPPFDQRIDELRRFTAHRKPR